MENNIVKVIDRIKNLLDKKNYNEILRICDRDDLKDDANIISFKILVLMRTNNYNEALELCNSILSKEYNERIEYQKIVLLEILYGTKEALKECSKQINLDKDSIILRRIKILKNQFQYEEAIKLFDSNPQFNDVKYKNYKKMIDQTRKLLAKKKTPGEEVGILTKLYADMIKLSEIDNADIDEWNKNILKIAYYEKYSKKTGIDFIKNLKKMYKEDTYKEKILNDLFSRLNSKKSHLFDIGHYEDLVSSKVDFGLALYLNKEKEKEDDKVLKEKIIEKNDVSIKLIDEKETKKKEKVKQVEITGVRVNNRYNQNTMNNNANNSINNRIDTTITIREYFKDEVIEIEKAIYSSNDNNARIVKAFDILDSIVYKKINDKEAVQTFINLVKRLKGITKLEENKVKKLAI